jgi:hypothetical protein
MMSHVRVRRAAARGTACLLALLFGLLSHPRTGEAQEFALIETPSVTALAIEQLKARTIAFNDHRQDPVADQGTGLIRFEDWTRVRPLQKQMLGLHPAYVEPTLAIKVDGVAKSVKEKLHMYVAEARFLVSKQPGDLARFATLAFLERLDPAIKHRVIPAGETMSSKHPDVSYLRNPAREWCAAGMQGICVQSRYKFEGRLPAAIMLANKLRENARPVADHVEFQSELRAVPVAELDAGNIAKLTGIATPITGVLEQNIFWVNQIMQFGRFLAVFQQHPTDATKTVASAFMVLAVKSDVLERKKEYEAVPVLRNLVPAQVLVGNSSFNTGTSISAGLPVYVRNRIKAIAAIMERE